MKKIRLIDVLKGYGLENSVCERTPGYARVLSAENNTAFRIDPPPLWPPVNGHMKEVMACFSTQFQDAVSNTPEQWEAMFRSFPNPQEELKRWLGLADAFFYITTNLGRRPTNGEQSDVLLIVWFASLTGPDPGLECLELAALSMEDAEFVREEYFALVKRGGKVVLA